jgi:hypothetical protein
VDGVPLRIYGPEKTVADCFKHRNKIGLEVALEALKTYRRRKSFNVDKLLRCARACRVEKVMGEGGPFRGREKDPKERQQWIVTTAVSSTAIEGVHFSKEKIENLLDDTPPACKPRKKKPSETRSPE